ncbi:hypothetical protein B0T18DRAFT_142213 [Schizothecium vesticola]|uniref:Secreted protein n=1 Tax=Schizothecium vesticola TaxID=314040 RepID=A0AA40EV58_9PEZI|nr:hypothetical protein B0T18DRAFT_142213 [Schizothecium vesticola]
MCLVESVSGIIWWWLLLSVKVCTDHLGLLMFRCGASASASDMLGQDEAIPASTEADDRAAPDSTKVTRAPKTEPPHHHHLHQRRSGRRKSNYGKADEPQAGPAAAVRACVRGVGSSYRVLGVFSSFLYQEDPWAARWQRVIG